ncbi:MAG: transferase [Euryarchaeota archaeon]|nr:transferase [Euryarchaeota archaeon]
MGKNVRIGKGTVIEAMAEVGVHPTGGTTRTTIGKDGLIRSQTIIYKGTRIGDGFKTGHGAVIREDNRIGDDVSIGTHSIIERDTVIEDGARVHSNCFVPEYVLIRRRAWIGPCVVMTNHLHPGCPQFKLQGKKDRDYCLRGPEIGEDAYVGAAAVLMPGIKVGKRALIGAGAVVTKDVPDDSVVAGNPAKVVRRVDELVCPPGHYERLYQWKS